MAKNPNSTPTTPNNEQQTSQDDIQAANSLRRFREQRAERAPAEATRLFNEVREIQRDFARRSATIQENGETMSKKEFERWEDAFTDEYDAAKREINSAGLNLDAEAEATQHMVTYTQDSELHKTIEAQAGNFYYERYNALRQAIQSSGDEDAEEDLKYLGGFLSSVERHLDYKYMTREEVRDYGPEAYERQRTAAHNNAIEHLNGLNRLAKKYSTRPFTVRNFWPSSIRQKRSQTPAIAKVMRYDRDIVEEYYAIAFSTEVREREAKQRRSERYGI